MGEVSYKVRKRYQDRAMKRYSLVFHRVSDKDVIEALDNSDNKTDYVRQSIRERISKENSKTT